MVVIPCEHFLPKDEFLCGARIDSEGDKGACVDNDGGEGTRAATGEEAGVPASLSTPNCS